MATKTLIAQSWKSHLPLVFDQWYLNVWDYYIMDKISESITQMNSHSITSDFVGKWFTVLERLHDVPICKSSFQPLRHYEFMEILKHCNLFFSWKL